MLATMFFMPLLLLDKVMIYLPLLTYSEDQEKEEPIRIEPAITHTN